MSRKSNFPSFMWYMALVVWSRVQQNKDACCLGHQPHNREVQNPCHQVNHSAIMECHTSKAEQIIARDDKSTPPPPTNHSAAFLPWQIYWHLKYAIHKWILYFNFSQIKQTYVTRCVVASQKSMSMWNSGAVALVEAESRSKKLLSPHDGPKDERICHRWGTISLL